MQRKKFEDQKDKLKDQQLRTHESKPCAMEYPGKFQKQKVVIYCNPKYPIKFIKCFLHFVKSYINVSVATHVHSSIEQFPRDLLTFCSEYQNKQKDIELHLTLIWKEIGIDPIMQLAGMHQVIGEVNIARYLNRLIESYYPHVLRYESKDVLYANQIDYYLEKIHSTLHRNTFHGIHRKSRYIMGEDISIVDIFLESLDRK